MTAVVREIQRKRAEDERVRAEGLAYENRVVGAMLEAFAKAQAAIAHGSAEEAQRARADFVMARAEAAACVMGMNATVFRGLTAGFIQFSKGWSDLSATTGPERACIGVILEGAAEIMGQHRKLAG